MTHDSEKVKQLLRLSPLVESSIDFETFLTELANHPERADSAAAVLYRAILAMGVEDPKDEEDIERRQYLKMLQDNMIPSLKAFKHVAGSQLFSMEIMSFLESAASGGAQRKKMIIIEGGPGSGKDYFKDGIVNAVERYTEEVQKVYVVEGCPHRENPLNLLRLFTPDTLRELADALGLGDALIKMVGAAIDPCPHCWKQVMGTISEKKTDPSLSQVKVLPIRLSARSVGIADWQPGGSVSLAASLDKANRGVTNMPDAFIERKPREGETDERLMLLDATQYKRIPGITDGDGEVTAASPLDTVIVCTTNRKALEEFLSTVVPDQEAFTSRAEQLRQRYNLVRCEEVRVYRDEMARFEKGPHYDPLVLHMLATLAVLSRQHAPQPNMPFAHPLDKMRLLQGEPIEVKARPSSEAKAVWNNTEPVGGGAPGGLSSDETAALTKLLNDNPLSAGILWKLAHPDEAMVGLDMRFMMSLLSSINQLGLLMPGEHQCVNSLVIMGFMRSVLSEKVKTSQNVSPEMKEVYERCLHWLGGPPKPNADGVVEDRLFFIESEYRRMLRELLLQVFEPNYEERAQKLFNDYRLHARAVFEGKPTVKDPTMGQIPVNPGLVDELDRLRLDKAAGAVLTDEDKEFRGKFDALVSVLRDEYVEEHGPDSAKEFKLTWESIPELGKAIRAKLDTEIGKVIEKLITTEVKSDLNEFEQQQLEEVQQALNERGFCPACLKPVLEYAKRTKVWSFKLNHLN